MSKVKLFLDIFNYAAQSVAILRALKIICVVCMLIREYEDYVCAIGAGLVVQCTSAVCL